MGKFYLGCDVSKGYADFVIIDQAKRVVESNFQLDDTIAGHQLLEQILKAFFEKKARRHVVCCGGKHRRI